MSGKLHLICMNAKIRCNFPDISYRSETQKNTFQFFCVSLRYAMSGDLPLICIKNQDGGETALDSLSS